MDGREVYLKASLKKSNENNQGKNKTRIHLREGKYFSEDLIVRCLIHNVSILFLVQNFVKILVSCKYLNIMMKIIKINTWQDWEAMKDALEQGDLVAIPTETVYGLAARADSAEAVEKIFKLKQRPSDNPLIVHIGHMDQLDELALDVSPQAHALAEHFWPGPLTLVLRSKGNLPSVTTAGLDSVAIRMPSHPTTLKLLQELDFPLAAPSANISGRPSPTLAEHVAADFEGQLEWILDAGPTEHGLVLDLRGEEIYVLRPGALSKTALNHFLRENGFPELKETANSQETDGQANPVAPGMKYRHYAPNASLEILSLKEALSKIESSSLQNIKALFLVAQNIPELSLYDQHGQRKMGELPEEWSQKLFAVFREADQKGYDKIIAIDPPKGEHHEALMNRLEKASIQR